MIAVDTNVFVRLLVRDDEAMTQAARVFVERNRCFVPITVVLETIWILGRSFNFAKIEIIDAFTKALALPQLEFEHGNGLVAALEWMREGLEIEDALHLAITPHGSRLATFDKSFARRAARMCGLDKIELLKA